MRERSGQLRGDAWRRPGRRGCRQAGWRWPGARWPRALPTGARWKATEGAAVVGWARSWATAAGPVPGKSSLSLLFLFLFSFLFCFLI